jgi:cytochrome c peroxidase
MAAWVQPVFGCEDKDLTALEMLGKHIFFDPISKPKLMMSCSTCHDPSVGFTFRQDKSINLGQVAITGANRHEIGSLKPPTSAYATFIPPFFGNCPNGVPGLCGGNFWNGRSEGNAVPLFSAGSTEHIGDEVFVKANGLPSPGLKAAYAKYLGPVADQALNPFTNPVEQNATRKAVCKHVKDAPYAELFGYAWGEPIDCKDRLDISYKRIAVALAAYQDSEDVNSFTSKRDEALAADADGKFPLDGFTAQENRGHDLFYNTRPIPFAPEVGTNLRPFPSLPITNCSFCHTSGPRVGVEPGLLGTDPLERYTDDAYHNIGTPANPEIPFAGDDPDEGLAGHTGNPAHLGFFKTPTLRNVDKRPKAKFPKAYAHNGWFKSLEGIVHFYSTADVNFPANIGQGLHRCAGNITTVEGALKDNCWPDPAYGGSAIGPLVGRLGLTAQDEADIVAYLKTLNDYHTAKPPKPHVKGKPLKPYKPIE